jgi:hypothetical protein
MKKWSMALVLAAVVPDAALAKEPEVLARTGKWVVDYDADGCHLYGQFGAGDDIVVARFSRYQPGDLFNLSLYGNRVRSGFQRSVAKIDFGLGRPAAKTGMNGTADKLPALFLSSVRLDGAQPYGKARPPAITPEQEAAVRQLTIDPEGKPAFRLDLGSLGKPFAQLRTCMEVLVRSWGYDPAVQATLSRPPAPVGSGASWISWKDYPSEALSSNQGGFVQFRLDVDAAGKVAGCHVLARTDPDEFADLTCRLLAKRARLQPALDAEGKPVPSFIVQRVNWTVG